MRWSTCVAVRGMHTGRNNVRKRGAHGSPHRGQSSSGRAAGAVIRPAGEREAVAHMGSGCRGLGAWARGTRGAGVGSTRDEAEARAGGRVWWGTATSAVW